MVLLALCCRSEADGHSARKRRKLGVMMILWIMNMSFQDKLMTVCLPVSCRDTI